MSATAGNTHTITYPGVTYSSVRDFEKEFNVGIRASFTDAKTGPFTLSIFVDTDANSTHYWQVEKAVPADVDMEAPNTGMSGPIFGGGYLSTRPTDASIKCFRLGTHVTIENSFSKTYELPAGVYGIIDSTTAGAINPPNLLKTLNTMISVDPPHANSKTSQGVLHLSLAGEHLQLMYTQKGYRVDWAQSTLGTLLGFDGSGKMHYGSDGGEFATLGGYSSSSTDYAISTITS